MEPESQCVCESGGTGRSKKKFRQKKKKKIIELEVIE